MKDNQNEAQESEKSISTEALAHRGTLVEIELVSENGEVEPLAFEIVPDKVADFKSQLLGESTPLAQAILGHKAGETLPYVVDDLVQVRILSVTPVETGNHRDVLERRQAILRKAVHQADLSNAIIFASAVDNKWGDYDPGALAENWEE